MIKLININKSYGNHKIFNNLSLEIEDGDFFCIYGESGKGKTTLLNILGLLENIDSGKIIFDEIENPRIKEINILQREKIGYIFQNFGLLENDTVKENLKISLKRFNYNNKEKEKLMIESLEKVKLENVLDKKIYELSGGEQQRIALSRLILKQPKYIFADEPTGNLDEFNTNLVFDILEKFNKENNTTVVFVTHNKELIERSKKSKKLPLSQ